MRFIRLTSEWKTHHILLTSSQTPQFEDIGSSSLIKIEDCIIGFLSATFPSDNDSEMNLLETQ